VRESVALIRGAGAEPCGVAIALDRQERATEDGHDVPWSAVQFVTTHMKLNVASIATLKDLLQYLENGQDPSLRAAAPRVQAYRDRYGT
jgi:orotate phosphoribosyltransferase